ncbi:hypothetical protein R2083_07385 [Nitrosomonas sp. Is35]|uniref:hypothetical protein n=1 Tax=Nitrosomonas sp. Is35 TaxID=3080534 RepID=UPI00294AFBBE|nr:hypothetical protein [Nitrosomonas sp. Is35]MDV6347336.1 hypothetical protein [Nitrosomonas sp. Is35]
MIAQKINVSHTLEDQRMALTLQQQTSILQLTLAMFNTAPGASNLMFLGSLLRSGQSLASLAQSLTESSLFLDRQYAAYLKPDEFSAKFVSDLVGDRVSIGDKGLVIDYMTHRMIDGATQGELIAELLSILSPIPASNSNWGKAASHHNARNATKVITHLLGSTFTPANIAIVVDYMLAQMAAGKTFGEMIVWAIDTVTGVDHDNVVWGNAAVLLNNRIEVSRYYSVDKAGTTIERATMRQILTKVTVDTATVAAAKTTIDHLLSNDSGFSNDTSDDFQFDKVLVIKKNNVLSLPQGTAKRTELMV